MVRAGRMAYDLARGHGKELIVHSIYRQAINLSADGNILITLLPEHKGCSPLSLSIDSSLFLQLQCKYRSEGDVFDVTDLGETAGFEVADLSLPRGLTLLPEEGRQRNIEACRTFLRRRGNLMGIAGYLFGMSNIYSDYITKKIRESQPVFNKEGIRATRPFMESFLGMGPGLTPAGDDFLYGLLGALYCIYTAKDFGLQELQFVSAAIAATEKTTLVSRNMLLSCINGEFHEWVRNLITAIAYGSREDTLDAAAKVIEIGSSSGSDIITGIVAGFECYFKGGL